MVAAAAGCAVGLGVTLVILGLRRAHDLPTESSTGLWTRWQTWWRDLSPRRRLWFAGALAGGVLTTVTTGWLPALLLVPGIGIVVPLLLVAPPNREIEVLAALDRWVRLLATSLSSGRSIRDAIFSTRHQAPPVLAGPVQRLCVRLDQRWSMKEALFAMADELRSADADAVVAALAIAAGRGGAGARATLAALSDNSQDRLRALREVAAERAKPRAVVRQVTFITLAVLGAAVLFNSQFFTPYRTPIGQLVALTLAFAYLGCLVVLRRQTVPAMAPRFLMSQP
ncbi:type II secretion system F family protein [Tessaracoccus massiliensis]|uniref:type II secretion system F family protein n=1 Tax=Tessaracoccus massiliensis TaxID=1522311 RepID=UPI00058BDAC4|nr:type II secretion system F family protein [Tessaracoccus massiliensis]